MQAFEKQTNKESFAKALQPSLNQIKKLLNGSNNNELSTYKESFMYVLQRFVAARYYYRKGAYQAGIVFDDELDRAIELLSSQAAYQQVLKPTQ